MLTGNALSASKRRGLVLALVLAAGLVPLLFPALEARAAADGRVTLATLEWPPYTAKHLPELGASSRVVREAFAAAGLETDIEFWPWRRAIVRARAGAEGVVAYFPGYHCEHEEGFIASAPIGLGPLGFAERSGTSLAWTSLEELTELRIGTVVGYANTDEFDRLAADGVLRTITSRDDRSNLLKLAKGELDLAVVDRLVMRYLLASDPALKAGERALRFNARPLEEKRLFLCFRDDAEGRALLARFNQGLSGLDSGALMDSYLPTAFPEQ